ncbi:MAG: hypothetical protein IJU86_03785, partial [Firmicutes bacterium]|nr:hypothetical protein [Bacillota bacterium]
MEEKEKIDVNGENETIESKIEKFCSGLKKMPMLSFPKLVIVSEKKKLELVESEIIKNLFSDLEEKNKFTDDQDVCYKTLVASILGDSLSFDNYKSKFKEMTNRDFLKKFIKRTINLNKYFSAMPKWKRICLTFLEFVPKVSGIAWLLDGILTGSKLMCFLGILVMCAWAGLICSLVFHLSLAVLIPSAIVLGFTTIFMLAGIVGSQMKIYEIRQEYGEDIDDFFNLVGEIDQYLDMHDLPPKKISSGEQIFDKSQINEK